MGATPAANGSSRWLIFGAFALVALGLAAGLLILSNGGRSGGISVASEAEVGFARDMMVHHAQAVEMALLIYDRTENDILRSIALDMMLTQQAQIGQMQGWLRLWDVPVAGTDLPMAWMGMPTEGLMTGMATDAQMNLLRQAAGVEADRLFISMMIPHHQSGIHMAEAVLERGDTPVVQAMAQAIIDAQQREIEELEALAAEL
ncbi:MAG: DUF305 domain-containing protein [bacterium]|nr:DUF305 domain-containing protein [bacterium]